MKRVSDSLRKSVWFKYAGNLNSTKCYVCEIPVNRYNKGWHCSHVIARARGGVNSLENLRVCCPTCNLKMKTKNLYFYINEIYSRSI